jgi:hypothetical protein
MIYKRDFFFSIYECYSWDMALNFSLDVSFDNMEDWKGIPEKVEVNITKAGVTRDETSC